MANVTENPELVNIVEAVCDRCGLMRSRRGGLVVNISGREHFICAICQNDLERRAHRDFLRAADLLGGAA